MDIDGELPRCPTVVLLGREENPNANSSIATSSSYYSLLEFQAHRRAGIPVTLTDQTLVPEQSDGTPLSRNLSLDHELGFGAKLGKGLTIVESTLAMCLKRVTGGKGSLESTRDEPTKGWTFGVSLGLSAVLRKLASFISPTTHAGCVDDGVDPQSLYVIPAFSDASSRSKFEVAKYHLVTWGLKILDVPFWMLYRTSKIPVTENLSDEEIVDLIKLKCCLKGTVYPVIRISKNTAVKICDTAIWGVSEARAMDIARRQTNIAIPRMRMVVPDDSYSFGEVLIVMDFIPNAELLSTAWPTLSLWKKLKVILTIRLYLRELRRIQDPLSANTPGRFLQSNTERWSTVQGPQFGENSLGPFSTRSALEDWFKGQYRRTFSRNAEKPPRKPLDASDFATLVFTHNHSTLGNFLLDDNGVLWMIDFGFAGMYPPWFEYIGMKFVALRDENPDSWIKCLKYIAEPDLRYEDWMTRIGYRPQPY